MAIAIIATLCDDSVKSYTWIIIGALVGGRRARSEPAG